MLEVGGNKSIEHAGKMISVMSSVIDGMSDSLTEQTISHSRATFDIASKPALSAPNMEKNLLLIGQAQEELEKKKNLILSAPKMDISDVSDIIDADIDDEDDL